MSADGFTEVCLQQYDYEVASTAARVFFSITAVVSVSLFTFYSFKYSHGQCTLYALYVQTITAGVYIISAAGYSDFIFADVALNGELRTIPIGRYMFWIVACPCVLFSFLALYSLVGPPVEPSLINFMVMKDVITLATGVVATYQQNIYVKGFFVVVSFSMGFWFLIDLYWLEQRRKEYLEGETVFWVRLTTYAFLVTWGIFPMLYLLGPNVLDMSSPDADYIGHALGDLMAKNIFGFLCWWVRYRVLVPYREGKGLVATNVYNPGFAPTHELNLRNQSLIRRPDTDGHWSLVTPAQLLVVEPDSAFQRLIMYLLEGTGVEYDIVFDFNQAHGVIRRGATDQFDLVLVNLSSHWAAPEQLAAFRKDCKSDPYNIPVVGYSFAESEEPQMRKEEVDCLLTDGLINYMLDPTRLTEDIRYWRETHDSWRARAQERLGETRFRKYGQAPQIRDEYAAGPSRHSIHPYSSSSSFSGGHPGHPAEQPQMMAASHPHPHAAGAPVSPGSPRSPGSPSARYASSPAGRTRRSLSFDQHPGVTVDAAGVVSNRPSSRGSFSGGFSGALPPGSPSARSAHSMNSPTTFNEGAAGPVQCDNHGCNMVAKLTCSGCHAKSYCTSYCQVKHWKSAHKKECNIGTDPSHVVLSDPPARR